MTIEVRAEHLATCRRACRSVLAKLFAGAGQGAANHIGRPIA